MGLKERMYELRTVEEVDAFLERYPTCVFFKAGSCHKTMQGFGYVEEALNKRENIHLAFVRVIECRPVSNYIAELTGIIHQSPQFILMVDKQPVYDVDNWNITLESLEQALQKNLGSNCDIRCSSDKNTSSIEKKSIGPYIDLLQNFVTGEISEDSFTKKWLLTFQSDASLRNTHEFALLNSLYGDVDAALSNGIQGKGNLKERAQVLLDKLTA